MDSVPCQGPILHGVPASPARGTESDVDPDANLEEMLGLAEHLVEAGDTESARLAELVLAMNEWLVKGGALPDEWEGGEEEDE